LREVARFGGDVSSFVPKAVHDRLDEKFGHGNGSVTP